MRRWAELWLTDASDFSPYDTPLCLSSVSSQNKEGLVKGLYFFL